MRILFTGATGVIGRRAVPGLIAAGHSVTGVAQSEEGMRRLEAAGARPLRLDLLDGDRVAESVIGHDAVIHYATAIPGGSDFGKRSAWAMNDRLRSEATSHLVAAARAAGAETFVQQSVTFAYADGGDAWLDEESPVEPPWDVIDSALVAERLVSGLTEAGGRGIVLRLSRLYGPGRVSGEFVEAVRRGRIPVVGSGENWVSHLHVDDAATALLVALEAPPGVYNVSEDEPVTSAESCDSSPICCGPNLRGRCRCGWPGWWPAPLPGCSPSHSGCPIVVFAPRPGGRPPTARLGKVGSACWRGEERASARSPVVVPAPPESESFASVDRWVGPIGPRPKESIMTARMTGTRDVHYDLVSVLYHTLQEADTLAAYIDDARQRGDDELADFFTAIQEEDRDRADRAKRLLGNRIEDMR